MKRIVLEPERKPERKPEGKPEVVTLIETEIARLEGKLAGLRLALDILK